MFKRTSHCLYIRSPALELNERNVEISKTVHGV